MRRVHRSFFAQPTLAVARELLGKILVIGSCSGRIIETEAYIGENDTACHAARGQTPRNRVMYSPPGHLYVYFTYGMHHCANIVTEREGFPAAVLLRAIEPLTGIEKMRERRGKKDRLADGPAKLCIALGMTKESHNGLDLCGDEPDGVFDDGFQPKKILIAPRIGIREGLDKLWRFYYKA
ncbi:DNA-3-methyladenine glycosylase [Candidatus Peregrinibacteria bacterium]|nr:DNA-3-methyladenine glycosylase [Candidatus Peregrinibacteria bacterium]